METSEDLKQMVKQKYTEIATHSKENNQSSCCGSGCCSTEVYNIMTDDYKQVEGYNPEADLGLGCGLPTQFADIKKGDVVIDLGSGAGNDCFIARHEAGETGKIIGIDFTEAMIEKARGNAEKLGFNNVEFRLGEIEKMPVGAGVADVVVSNCVLNLVPDKSAAFNEIFRVLKPGGHFSISDVVLIGELPGEVIKNAEMYAGCVAGALQKNEYLALIEKSGFIAISVQKEKPIVIPDDILLKIVSQQTIDEYIQSGKGIYSVTVYAEKPEEKESCCAPGCCQ